VQLVADVIIAPPALLKEHNLRGKLNCFIFSGANLNQDLMRGYSEYVISSYCVTITDTSTVSTDITTHPHQ